MKVGNGMEPGVAQGPLINAAAVAKVEEHIADATRRGARIVTGGHRHKLGGNFFEPTLLADVSLDSLIFREETFGPVAGVTVFDTEDDAIRMANDTIYGLAAYFHTRDYARLLRVAERRASGIGGAQAGILPPAAAPFRRTKEAGPGRGRRPPARAAGSPEGTAFRSG